MSRITPVVAALALAAGLVSFAPTTAQAFGNPCPALGIEACPKYTPRPGLPLHFLLGPSAAMRTMPVHRHR